MGLEFTLSDRELPVSPVFVHFLAQVLSGRRFEGESWADQRSESLWPREVNLERVTEAAAIVMGSPLGRERLARAYTLLFALLTGDFAPVHEVQSRFHFVNVIGIPRTGGSYCSQRESRKWSFRPYNWTTL